MSIIINKARRMNAMGWIGLSMRCGYKYAYTARNMYNKDLSMLSKQVSQYNFSIQAIKRFGDFTHFMKEVQSNLTPRAYSVASRKMAYYCVKSDFFSFDQPGRQYLHHFYAKLFQLDQKLLSPIECLSIFYFIRVSSEHAAELSINKDQIVDFINKLLDQTVKNIEYMNFNKCCDFLAELAKFKISYGIDHPEYEQIILQRCLQNFPHSDQKVDSIFHFSTLLFNLLQMPQRRAHKELFILACQSISELAKYYNLALKLRLVDVILGNFKQISDQQEVAEVHKTFEVVFSQIKNDLDSNLKEDYNECAVEINEILEQIRATRFEGEDIMQRIALAMSSIKKVKKTDAEKQKARQESDEAAEEQKEQLDN